MKSHDLTFTDENIQLIEIVADREISSTQSIKTLIIEKKGKRYIAFQKWWRESNNQPWREGKGFHIESSEVDDIITSLERASDMLRSQDWRS